MALRCCVESGSGGAWVDVDIVSTIKKLGVPHVTYFLSVHAFSVVVLSVHDVIDATLGSIPGCLVLDAGALGDDRGAQGLTSNIDGGASHINDGFDGKQETDACQREAQRGER